MLHYTGLCSGSAHSLDVVSWPVHFDKTEVLHVVVVVVVGLDVAVVVAVVGVLVVGVVVVVIHGIGIAVFDTCHHT